MGIFDDFEYDEDACENCTPFSWCEKHRVELPDVEHDVIGVCICGHAAHVMLDGRKFCFVCAYDHVT